MEKVTGIGGVFFRSRDPEFLAAWYRDNLGVDPISEGFWKQEAGHTVFAPFASDTEYFGRPDQQWMINFRVSDLNAMRAQLARSGIESETRDEWDTPETGRFARLHDPDGNPIELWEPPH
ncbi:MAG: VOC family protein [Roseovarius sp.]|uniref:VOC family protein n=1 Tax=Roseovarius sp. TaxID=1486281 RepID=UPI0032EBBC1A